MAKFYGQVEGSASTVATRRGSAKSGIKASVQSWSGSVITELSENKDGETIVSVSFQMNLLLAVEKYLEEQSQN